MYYIYIVLIVKLYTNFFRNICFTELFLGFKKITHFKIYDEHAYILIYQFICL